MGNAGRVLMIPKGEYNSATTYEMLDFVYYQGRSYVCKQTSTGNVPTNTTYWQALTGDASAEIQALTNYVGDTGVKNLWNIKALASTTQAGVTYTINNDGTIDAVGTLNATESVFPTNELNAMKSYDLKPNTTYKISLGITLSATRKIQIFIKETESSSWSQVVNQNTGTEAEFTTPASWYQLWIRFNATGNGTTVNEKLYPMIRESVFTDPTYQPHPKTNAELTADTALNVVDVTSLLDPTYCDIANSSVKCYTMGKFALIKGFFKAASSFSASARLISALPDSVKAPSEAYVNIGYSDSTWLGLQVYGSYFELKQGSVVADKYASFEIMYVLA